MLQACPINYKSINATIFRVASFYVILMLTLFAVTQNVIILYVLAMDTFFRVYGPKQFSPIFHLANLTKKVLHLKNRMEDAGAKRLAGQFAILFVLLLIVGAHLETYLFVYITAAIFAFCSTLELLFDYCIGCKIYFILKHFFPGFST